MLGGTVIWETSSIIDDTVSTYNRFKRRISEEITERHGMSSGFRKNTSNEGDVSVTLFELTADQLNLSGETKKRE